MIILICVLAFAATLFGGLFALRFKDKLHLILGLSAGAVIGVAFFDLIPEAIELAGTRYEISLVTSVIALGFVIFMILDRFVIFHSHHHEENPLACHDCEHVHEVEQHTNLRGRFGAGSLSVHSFLDGAAIGLAFQVSPAIGAIVATAVLAHKFSDGINTVSMILKNGGTKRNTFTWLLISALAPVAGIVSTLFFSVPEHILGIILAIFAGFFLYIGASDLLPESHHSHPTIWTTVATLLGIGILYAVIQVAGH